MSLLKENKIHLHGFTDGFTYNDVDYFLDNHDKDVYELYFKEVQNELIKFKCDVLEFKEDIDDRSYWTGLTGFHRIKTTPGVSRT